MISHHMLAARACSSYLINSELKKEITYIYIYKLHFWSNQLLGFCFCSQQAIWRTHTRKEKSEPRKSTFWAGKRKHFHGKTICCCLVAQLCPTRDPMDPTRLFCPWDFPGKNTGVGCHFPLQRPSQSREESIPG